MYTLTGKNSKQELPLKKSKIGSRTSIIFALRIKILKNFSTL